MAVRTIGLRVLTAREAQVLGTLAGVLFPRDRKIDLDEDDADVVGFLDRYAGKLPAPQRQNLAALVAGTEVVWMGWRKRPGSIADASDADVREFVDHWSRHSTYTVRQAWLAVKSLLAFAYVEHPDVLAAIGAGDRA